MKLTAASLAAQSAEAFDGSPEVAGELEGYVRYVLTKESNTLLVADTKEDQGDQKAKCARFDFNKLPDGCGKGAKVKLLGIQFVKKVGRDYNGKTYYDMVYSFATCEVLEAGAARPGGFGGKGWQPKSPEERASIEAQNIMTSSVQFGLRVYENDPKCDGLDYALAKVDMVFDHLWAKLQATKRAAAAAQSSQPSTAQGQPAANGTPGGSTTAKPAKAAPAQQQRNGDDPQNVYEAVRSTRTEVETFRKCIGNAIGVFDDENVDAAIARAGKLLYGDAYGGKGIEFLSDAAQAEILKQLRSKGKVSTVGLGHRSGSFAVHSSIARLRKAGFRIGCDRTQNKTRKSWYYLIRSKRKAKKHEKTK